MEHTDKHVYETPTATVFEVKTEGVLCWSNVYQSIWFFNAASDEWGRDSYTSGGNTSWD